jgi:hypothetical protein
MKKYIFIYLTLFIIITCIIIYNLKFNTNLKLGFTNNNTKNIILLGDSILNNSNYVDPEDSVSALIKKTCNNNNIILKAQDNAKIENVYAQVDSLIGNNLDNKDTYIFLSIGGNNIIEDNQILKLDNLKKEYFKLLSYIRNNFLKTKIYLVGLYYPFDPRFKKYTTTINNWNKIIRNLGYNYIMLDSVVTNKQDLIFAIEPSATGGKKIAKEICNVL